MNFVLLVTFYSVQDRAHGYVERRSPIRFERVCITLKNIDHNNNNNNNSEEEEEEENESQSRNVFDRMSRRDCSSSSSRKHGMLMDS